MKKILFVICLVLGYSSFVFPQLVVNEFLASNTGDFIDPDFGESADWIEVINIGTEPVDLSNYYISDDLSDSVKWKISESTELASGEFYIIWADGMNQGKHTSFKLSASGEEIGIFDLQGKLIDSVTFRAQEPNISMGREPDGTGKWVYFIEPTLGTTNNNNSFEGIVKNEPYFSVLGGIFDAPLTVEVRNLFDGEIRYTLDGSEPTSDSPIYNSPISISKNTVVRARIFNGDQIPGPTITHSYFINNGNIGDLPIVSISSEPGNFWDSETGIYVQSFKPQWEIPINIELFENDGSDRAGFNLKAGAKVNGLFSWQLPQKMLGIYFRKDYGKGKLEYPMFENRDRTIFNSFSLRASGSDWAYTLFRDALGQYLTEENMDVDFQEYKPCVVYVNGEYMGIHNIRPKIDEDLVWYAHDLEGVDVDVIENEMNVEDGTMDAYAAFKELYSRDLTVKSTYDSVLNLIDEENLADYLIAEIYDRNTSMDHNVFAWKPVGNGEWKWVLGDLDRGFFTPTSHFLTYFGNEGSTPFKQLMKNPVYAKYFGRRMADQLFTTYNVNRVKLVIDQFKNRIANEIDRHVTRWEGTTSGYGSAIPSYEYWESQVDALKSYAEQRPVAIIENMTELGLGTPIELGVKSFPEGAGTIYFNGLKCLVNNSIGKYFQNDTIHLVADAKSGYDFVGWEKDTISELISSGAKWKYNDVGVKPVNWNSALYDDSSWLAGDAQLGYGDGDENTIISYGSDSGNKIISYYFRKSFTVEKPGDGNFLDIDLMCDDGAVVYINGTEVLRQNMPTGAIDASTTALVAIGGTSESAFTNYQIENVTLNANNVIAVEIHQSSPSSSDVSFDLRLSAFNNSSDELISESDALEYIHTDECALVAVFEKNDGCVLPNIIDTELTLSQQCSLYYVPQNSMITETGSLIIPDGIELLFDDDVSLTVNGKLTVNGTDDSPVYFRSNPNSSRKRWGIVNIVNADTCLLKNVVIEDASRGASRVTQNAAISIFNSTVKLDKLIIENVFSNPIAARYSDVTLINSSLHSEVTGDLINVKYGKGYIENCKFIGNPMPDTDAIDYDDIENGVIKNSVIQNLNGVNSDAIDIGEQAQNILIDNVFVYNITDKGVSVGQQSSARIQNSTFVNCNLGAGLKDSSKVTIDHCTYYGCVIPIACYEKNVGSAGGNAWVTSTIMSNAYDESYVVDNQSFLTFSHSLSDSDTIRIGSNNIRANPQFVAPDYLNFELLATSPALNKGLIGNIGATQNIQVSKEGLAITGINAGELTETVEYLVISNIGESTIDISGYKLNDGVQFTFGENVVIDAGENIFVTNNKNNFIWKNAISQVFQWDEGKLDNNGEKVVLVSANDMFIDQVRYRNENPWPILSAGDTFLSLKEWGSDNHLGENWTIQVLDSVFIASSELVAENELKLYPNPTTGIVYLENLEAGANISVYDIRGQLVYKTKYSQLNQMLDLTNLPNGFYFVRSGAHVQKISKL